MVFCCGNIDNMKREIMPACMPERFDDVAETAALVAQQVQTIQLDLMDGKYVPEKTWPFYYAEDYNLQDLKKGEQGLPFWEQVNYELDLMVERPEERLQDWLDIGASRIIFHYASIYNWDILRTIDSQVRNFTQIGLAITVHDDLDQVKEILNEGIFDFVQVMGIEHIGYMGEPFTEDCLDVIAFIKEHFPALPISVDGGVSGETISLLRDAGVERFVSGSGVFGHGIPAENVVFLEEIANS